MVRRLGLGKNNHLTYNSLALNPRIGVTVWEKEQSDQGHYCSAHVYLSEHPVKTLIRLCIWDRFESLHGAYVWSLIFMPMPVADGHIVFTQYVCVCGFVCYQSRVWTITFFIPWWILKSLGRNVYHYEMMCCTQDPGPSLQGQDHI